MQPTICGGDYTNSFSTIPDPELDIPMRFFLSVPLLLISQVALGVAQDKTPLGNAVIRGKYASSEIVIRTTDRLAGAIDSLQWNGQEFIDSADHGRQLQSASNFDVGSAFSPETFNPTEAGSRLDGAGPKSSSRLLHLVAKENQLQTTSRMAFWLQPGEKSGDNLAKNMTVLSNHLLTKRVTIGYRDFPNVIQYDVTFGVPIGEQHRYAQFEAVTGYMPPVFGRFLTFDVGSRKLAEISDGPGEQKHPVVFATKSGSHAMGIYSPDQPSKGFESAGYGRFRFAPQKVVKWNCVFRVRSPQFIEAADYNFRMFVIVGDLRSVKTTMDALTRGVKSR